MSVTAPPARRSASCWPGPTLLGETHVEQLAAALHLLLGELAALSERVAVLDGAPPEESRQRIEQLTQFVLEPLRRG